MICEWYKCNHQYLSLRKMASNGRRITRPIVQRYVLSIFRYVFCDGGGSGGGGSGGGGDGGGGGAVVALAVVVVSLRMIPR